MSAAAKARDALPFLLTPVEAALSTERGADPFEGLGGKGIAILRLPREALAEGIVPNLRAITAAWNAGQIAVLFYGFAPPSAKWREVLGWSGARVQVARLTRQQRTWLVNATDAVCSDGRAASRWLRREGGHRLLVLLASDILCLNFDAETGFTEEPGT